MKNDIKIASTDTMLKWLKNQYTEVSVKFDYINDKWRATAWDRYHDTGHVQDSKSPSAALRKLCRAVKKELEK